MAYGSLGGSAASGAVFCSHTQVEPQTAVGVILWSPGGERMSFFLSQLCAISSASFSFLTFFMLRFQIAFELGVLVLVQQQGDE